MDFKTFIILSFVFIYKTIEAIFSPYRSYITGVTGGLKCGLSRNGKALIFVSTNSYPKIDKHFCARELTRFESLFFINAKITSAGKPYLYLKIVHTCMLYKKGYVRILVGGIPRKYVLKGFKPTYFHLSWLDLTTDPGTLVKVSQKKRNLLKMLEE